MRSEDQLFVHTKWAMESQVRLAYSLIGYAFVLSGNP